MSEIAERPPYDISALRRREFPAFKERGAIYLNSASVGPLPERTRLALLEFMEEARTPDHRVYDYVIEIPDTARELCA